MKKKNQTSATNRYLLVGLSLLCILMMVFSSFSEKVSGPFKVLANYTVIPLQQGINQIGGWLGDLSDNFETLQQLRTENEKLQEQVDSLVTENSTLQEERYELERLRELYQLDQNYSDYEKTAAHVIGKDSGNWFSTFTIDKGSEDGIEVDMNVMAGSGLVGIVVEVGPSWAKVRSIIDDSSQVSAMAQQSGDTCIVSGDLRLFKEGRLRLSYMEKDDDVKDGDMIVTSNISGKFLPGILIGYATDITVDYHDNLTKSGYLIPAARFDRLQEVLVITDLKDAGPELDE